MQGMVPLCGFGGVPYSAVRKAAPRNLLDNSDFRNPVNQRGIVSGNTYEPWTYTLDRWKTGEVATTLGLENNGITLNGELGQAFPSDICERLDGKTVTIAAKIDGDIACKSGTISQTGTWTEFVSLVLGNADCSVYAEANGSLWFFIYTEETVSVEWIALYEGEYTAETLPEYQPKGYGAELAECQRYYVKVVSTSNGFITGSAKEIRVGLVLPAEMRVTPTILTANLSGVRTTLSTNTTPTVKSIIISNFSGTQLAITFTIDTSSLNAENNTPIGCYVNAEFSADL